jgi:hypothetical protein
MDEQLIIDAFTQVLAPDNETRKNSEIYLNSLQG